MDGLVRDTNFMYTICSF